jgi:hypothetical protein
MRLTHELNVDKDAYVDGSDVKTYFAYDERWRVVGTYDSPTSASHVTFGAPSLGDDARSPQFIHSCRAD